MKYIIKRFFIGLILWTLANPLFAQSKHISWADGTSSLDFMDDSSLTLEKSIKMSKSKFAKNIYKSMLYTPIWIDEKGLTHFGDEMIDIMENDTTLDVNMPSKKLYLEVKKDLADIKSKNGGSLTDKLALELKFTALYKAYAQYTLYGGINWSAFKKKLKRLEKIRKSDAGWIVYNPKKTAIDILNDAINNGDLKMALLDAEPKRFKYKKLKKYLIKYINIKKNKSWKELPKYSQKIKKGMVSRAIPMIRNNLLLEGDIKSCPIDGNHTKSYDECLVKAVKRFQLRNGMKADGVIGKGTYTALQISPSKKIKSIRLNMDKIKRFRRKEARVRIELNIPSFRLQFYDAQKLVSTMRVVVGKTNHPTPVFGNEVRYIVVNPWWKIPESIVKKEMLRHLIEDPYYYERRGKVLHATWSEDSERIDPGSVNWADYTGSRHVPYRFMQVPSRHNALGKIKFIFPNKFSVYLHDTPSKNLFFRSTRAFSHGCMRIQKPREMLENFALFNDNIDVDAVMKRLEGTEKRVISLKTRVPVDITYLTAFVDDYGNINFRKDIYGYDKRILKDYNYIVDKYSIGSVQTKANKIQYQENDILKPESIIEKKEIKKSIVEPKKSPEKIEKKPKNTMKKLKKEIPKIVEMPVQTIKETEKNASKIVKNVLSSKEKPKSNEAELKTLSTKAKKIKESNLTEETVAQAKEKTEPINGGLGDMDYTISEEYPAY